MSDDNMEGDIRKLLALLKKIIKNHPQGSDSMAHLLDQKAFNLNLCFLTMVPMSPEDAVEFEEMYQELMNQPEEFSAGYKDGKLDFRLNPEDLVFLRKHGIRFEP